MKENLLRHFSKLLLLLTTRIESAGAPRGYVKRKSTSGHPSSGVDSFTGMNTNSRSSSSAAPVATRRTAGGKRIVSGSGKIVSGGVVFERCVFHEIWCILLRLICQAKNLLISAMESVLFPMLADEMEQQEEDKREEDDQKEDDDLMMGRS